MKYIQNCIFIGEAGFNINTSPSACSIRGTPAFIEASSTRSVSHIILCAISANDVVSNAIREAMKSKQLWVIGKKRKKPTITKAPSRDTVTGHYIKFISKTLDEMDKFPEMSSYYILVDNAPIHTSQDITRMIETRGYIAIYILPYFPELNPIENILSVLKRAVK